MRHFCYPILGQANFCEVSAGKIQIKHRSHMPHKQLPDVH